MPRRLTHSPGPWHLVNDEFNRGVIVAEDDNHIAKVTAGPYDPRPPGTTEQAQAHDGNVLLILHAPEMLATLESVLPFLEEAAAGGHDVEATKLLNTTRATIRRATTEPD